MPSLTVRVAIVSTLLAVLGLLAVGQADTLQSLMSMASIDYAQPDSVDDPNAPSDEDDTTEVMLREQPIEEADTSVTPWDSMLGRDGSPLDPEQVELGQKIRETLAMYEAKHLNARDHSSWEVMHSLIAYGPRTQIYRDGPGGSTVNAIGWLMWGGRCQGQPLMMLENGRPHALRGVGLQGHDGQFLAMLSQWKVKPESPMKLGGREFTVADLIEEEKATCQSGTELTFKLIALSHYLPSDATWKSRYGEEWNIPKLIKAEIEAPIRGAACGGSHRLFGISNAYKVRMARGEPVDGEYARAQKYITDYHRYTLGRLQNSDGSFSTEWFTRPADRQGDLDRKLQTTGHILEWMAWSVPKEQLRDPAVMKAADFLSDILLKNPERSWSIGPLGHGLHALMIYHDRVYKDSPLPERPLASQPISTPARDRPAVSADNPPEPDCDHCLELMPEYRSKSPAKVSNDRSNPLFEEPATKITSERNSSTEQLKKRLDQTDGCVEAFELHEAVRQALGKPGSTREDDPIVRPTAIRGLRQ